MSTSDANTKYSQYKEQTIKRLKTEIKMRVH